MILYEIDMNILAERLAMYIRYVIVIRNMDYIHSNVFLVSSKKELFCVVCIVHMDVCCRHVVFPN